MKKLYSLIDKIYQPENLGKAFKQVKRNHGAPGIDGETPVRIRMGEIFQFCSKAISARYD